MAKNLVSLRLVDCPSLTEVPSSLQYLDKLEEIDLSGCYNLRSFPMLDSKVLRYLHISRCLDMTTCPTISQNMELLILPETSIKEVPQSVTGRLELLWLSGCSKMTKFPENLKDIEDLSLTRSAIKEVPSSIQYLTRLYNLNMSGSSKLESFPEITVPMESLRYLFLSETGIKEIPLISFKHMISLRSLFLDGTPIKELPLSIKDMVHLEDLTLHGTPIKALPELPPSLKTLTTHDCSSLETVTSIINIGRLQLRWDFTNCFKLDQKQLIEAMHLKIQSGDQISPRGIQMVLRGSEIPEWFGDKGIGSSVTIQLPSNCHQLKGIAFCLVFLLPLPSQDTLYYEFGDRYDAKVYCDYHVKSKNGEHDGDDEVVLASGNTYVMTFNMKKWDSNHMVLHYISNFILVNRLHLREYSGNEVTFKFYHSIHNHHGRKVGHEIRRPFELKSWGVYLHFDENLPADKSSEEN
ncbi:hypothetical protein H0E87_030407 [Populus deltoides]|uniref:C-JID domain-containing protein n=1 Tax=Populus deltoides TaxID=3696 RepID=A0A8T2WJ34_POPDE|nr:hypothetical protein H0E87_030407 [Populus deltoides]